MKRSLSNLVLRASGMLVLAGSLACGSSLEDPGAVDSAVAMGSGGARSGGVSGGGGGIGSGGRAGGGGVPSSGGATSSGGGPDAGGLAGTGGLQSTGGGPGPDGAAGAGGNTSLDGGRDVLIPSDGPTADHPDDATGGERDATGGGADMRGTDALSAGTQEYVSTYLEPYCTRLSECCAQAGFTFSGMGPCKDYELGFVKYLNDGSEVVVPSVIQTLLDQMKNSCDHPSYVLIGATTDGVRLSGQSCDAVDQCAGTPALCLNGTCMTPPRGKPGDGCAATCDDTTVCKWGTSGGKSPYAVCYDQDGLRCDSTTNTCVAVTAVGKPCTTFAECGAHGSCESEICKALVQLGQECGRGPSCDRNLQCISGGAGAKSTCKTLSMGWSGSCSP